MEKVKVALIGYGHLGKWHAQKADQLENSELVAIVESFPQNQQAAKEAHPNVKVVEDLNEVINEIDAALIVTPTSLHFDIAKDLLKANKHIFCEKPLCSSLQQAQELSQYKKDVKLQVGHSERCHAAWEELRPTFTELPANKMIRLQRFAPFKGRATDVDVVQDLMIHDIDLLLYLFPHKIKSVRALGQKIRTANWDHVTAHFYFENGDEAMIVSGRNHVKEERSLEVMSEKGCHFVDLFQNKISYATHGQFDSGEYVQTHSYEKRDHLLIEQKAFYESILQDKKEFVTYEDGVAAIKIIECVLKSLDTHQEVQIND
ncbi:MAG: hypothetical protein CME62_16045 [Halobacteriovoraceae bacterium]|nr:hypothetical protein [Halobacteriovoraceae bacterium]|tara:strand:- start:7659 stop:8609 length:951 start_codon:yes stop_codon:yes gene_type:complete